MTSEEINIPPPTITGIRILKISVYCDGFSLIIKKPPRPTRNKNIIVGVNILSDQSVVFNLVLLLTRTIEYILSPIIPKIPSLYTIYPSVSLISTLNWTF